MSGLVSPKDFPNVPDDDRGYVLSGKLINLIRRLLNRRVTGPNVFEDQTGWHIRASSPGSGRDEFWAKLTSTPDSDDTTLAARRLNIFTDDLYGDTLVVQVTYHGGGTKLSECIPEIVSGQKIRVAIDGYDSGLPTYRCTSHVFTKWSPCEES